MNNSKNDYYFDLPICERCNNYLKIKTGISSKQGQLVLFFSIVGLITSIFIGFLTFSVLFGIAIFSISILFPSLNYRAKTKNKIQLSHFIQINAKNDPKNTIKITFLNQNYADYTNNINLEKYNTIEEPKELIESSTAAHELKTPDFKEKVEIKSIDNNIIGRDELTQPQYTESEQDENIFELTLPDEKEQNIKEEKKILTEIPKQNEDEVKKVNVNLDTDDSEEKE